jgi:quinol monooxygenase YgiN
MELFIFGRFHAIEGQEEAVAAAIAEVVPQTRAEPGCRDVGGYRSVADPRLFYIHSRWISREAFEAHVNLPHTVRFIGCVEQLVDHPVNVTRAEVFV